MQILGFDRDITVGNDQDVIFGLAQQVVQRADFVVTTDDFWIDHQHDIMMRKITLQALDDGNSRIVRVLMPQSN